MLSTDDYRAYRAVDDIFPDGAVNDSDGEYGYTPTGRIVTLRQSLNSTLRRRLARDLRRRLECMNMAASANETRCHYGHVTHVGPDIQHYIAGPK